MILTLNEELHIRRCIESAKRLTTNVFVVDSSTDDTVAIARRAGAAVLSGVFPRFADKLNWSLENIDFPTPWVLRLDADEVLSDALVEGLARAVEEVPEDVVGVYVPRQLWFMGRWVRHGGMYPVFQMRLWKKGAVRCESRDTDQHMIIRAGSAAHFNLDIIDNPLSGLSKWIEKHNRYAILEAHSRLSADAVDTDSLIKPSLIGNSTQRMRWIKLKLFYRLPLFVRPIAYFTYRYFLRLGFLDGKTGFLFHFLHGFWYRVLVDAYILEEVSKGRGHNSKGG